MSGECDKCGEHCLECHCMKQDHVIKIWAQMFFEDGSLTQGIRVPAEWLDEQYEWKIGHVADMLMKSVNRDEGWLLLWGAGNIVFNHYPTSCVKMPSALESNS